MNSNQRRIPSTEAEVNALFEPTQEPTLRERLQLRRDEFVAALVKLDRLISLMDSPGPLTGKDVQEALDLVLHTG